MHYFGNFQKVMSKGSQLKKKKLLFVFAALKVLIPSEKIHFCSKV